jgi:beta-phosphoglucomutase-like phosphatase (HAD superfamily)
MKFKAILWDCDGVLMDSEPITNGVLRDMLAEAGWVMSPQACMAHFVGKAVKDERAAIEHHTGHALTEAWLAEFRARRDERLLAQVEPIDGAPAALERLYGRYRGRMACASGADRGKVELMLGKAHLLRWFDGAIFSGHETPRSKPYPDVYLAAAAHLQVDPADCLVIEDTTTGVRAGVAAGATVWGYAPAGALSVSASALLAAGAQQVFASMHALPAAIADAGRLPPMAGEHLCSEASQSA